MSFFRNDEDPKAPERAPDGESRIVPLLPLRDIVVFPNMVVPLFVGRPKSIKALEDAVADGRELLLSSQRVAAKDEPGEDDIFRIGTLGSVIQLLRLPDQTVKVLVEGKARARIRSFTQAEPYFACDIELLEDNDAETPELEALVRESPGEASRESSSLPERAKRP